MLTIHEKLTEKRRSRKVNIREQTGSAPHLAFSSIVSNGASVMNAFNSRKVSMRSINATVYASAVNSRARKERIRRATPNSKTSAGKSTAWNALTAPEMETKNYLGV